MASDTPQTDKLLERWVDDGATRGAAFIELRDLCLQYEKALRPHLNKRYVPEKDYNELSKRLSAAQSQIAALKADAERYRWLRHRVEVREQESMAGKRKPGLIVAMGMTFFDCSTVRTSDYCKRKADELDSAIDAALHAKQPENA